MDSLKPIIQHSSFDPNRKPRVSPEGFQMVRAVPYSQGFVFLDSSFDNENITPGFNDNFFSLPAGREFMGKQTTKMSIDKMKYEINIPNINERNNTVEIISSNTGPTVHTVDLIEGLYLTSTALMDHLVLRLNTLTGSTGLTFSHLVDPSNPQIYTLTSAGGTYHFTLNQTHTTMIKGKFLYNLPRSQTLQASKKVGYVLGYYTRYIDFISTTLTEEQRVPSAETGIRTGHSLIYRLFLPTLARASSSQDDGEDIIDNLRWISKEQTKSIITVDIKLYDEFGENLYTPSYDDDTPINTWFDMVMLVR